MPRPATPANTTARRSQTPTPTPPLPPKGSKYEHSSSSSPSLSFRARIAKDLFPVDRSSHKPLVQRGHQVRVPRDQEFIGAGPLVAAFPTGLGKPDHGRVAACLELKNGPRPLRPYLGKL